MVDVADYALGVYYVGEPGGARPEPPPDIVEAPNLAGGIAAQVNGKAVGLGKPLQPFNVIRADAYDQGIPVLKVLLGVSKLPSLHGSTMGERSEEEIDDNVLAPVVGEVELPARIQGYGKGWRRSADSQHYGHRLKVGVVRCQRPA